MGYLHLIQQFLDYFGAQTSIKYSDLLEVYGVGTGFYLGLAILQAVSGAQIWRIRRKQQSILDLIRAMKANGHRREFRRVSGEFSNIEIKIDQFQRKLFLVVAGLFFLAVGFFVFAVFSLEVSLLFGGVWLVLFYYLVLPCLLFLASAWRIACLCKGIEVQFEKLSRDVRSSV